MEPQDRMPSTAMRVGVIGAGRMGRAHLQATSELGLSIASICDMRDENLARQGEEFSVPPDRRFRDAEAMLAEMPSLDLVIVSTTADSHRDLVVRAAGSGARHILCEKPMATSLADCEAMIAACRSSGTRLAVNHQMRFMDQYTLVKKELESGRFGALASMNVVAGNFGLAMNGSHYFEAFSYLSGQPVESVTAWLWGDEIVNPRGPQFRDQSGEVRAVGGAGQRLNMEIAGDQGHGMTVTYATAYGHIIVDELQGVYYATARKPEHRAMPSTRYGMPWDRWQVDFPQADNVGPTKAVLRSLLSGAGYPTGEDGRNVVAALTAAYRSAAEGNSAVALSGLADYSERRFPWA